jgi:hypothetical protein
MVLVAYLGESDPLAIEFSWERLRTTNQGHLLLIVLILVPHQLHKLIVLSLQFPRLHLGKSQSILAVLSDVFDLPVLVSQGLSQLAYLPLQNFLLVGIDIDVIVFNNTDQLLVLYLENLHLVLILLQLLLQLLHLRRVVETIVTYTLPVSVYHLNQLTQLLYRLLLLSQHLRII